jgi:hypothetical protein
VGEGKLATTGILGRNLGGCGCEVLVCGLTSVGSVKIGNGVTVDGSAKRKFAKGKAEKLGEEGVEDTRATGDGGEREWGVEDEGERGKRGVEWLNPPGTNGDSESK